MNRPTRRLTERFVKTVERPGRYSGEHGLSLLVKPTSQGWLSKTWSQRFRVDGKQVRVALGAYPKVSAKMAEDKSRQQWVAFYLDGVVPNRASRPSAKPQGPKFRDAVEEVIALHAPTWKRRELTEKQWRSAYETYIFPVIGDRPVGSVQAADLLEILKPLTTEKPAMAKKVRQRIAAVMDWSVVQGHRQDNPAEGRALNKALPKRNGNGGHYKALLHSEVGSALERIRESGAWIATKLSLEFMALTAARGGEVRAARWNEIDGETWVIPAENTKTGKPHRVPLSRQALEVLKQARQMSMRQTGLIFPGNTGREISGHNCNKLFKKLGIDAVPHGFRSSFRDWCGETGQPREVAEASLAHATGNATEQAYARSDLLARRRPLMQEWADYVG